MEVSSKKEEIDLVPMHTCKKWYAVEVKIYIFPARKRSCVKVVFLHLSVILFTYIQTKENILWNRG